MANKKNLPSQPAPSGLDKPQDDTLAAHHQAPPSLQSRPAGFASSSRQEIYQATGIIPAFLFPEYEQTETGRAYVEAIIAQTHHRMGLEQVVVRGDNKRADRGQVFALYVALFFGSIGGGLVYLGHDAAGTTIATSAVVGLVTAFIKGADSRRAEREKKAAIMAEQNQASEQPKEETPQLPGI